MKRNATIPSQPWPAGAEAVTVRMAVAADTAALSRLAQLDSAPPLTLCQRWSQRCEASFARRLPSAPDVLRRPRAVRAVHVVRA